MDKKSKNLGAAIVTGGARGVGCEISKRLAAMGFPVLVNYVAQEESARSVVDEITQAGGRAVSMPGDVSEAKTASALFERAIEEFGRVQVLVNNAGVGSHQWTPIAEVEEDTYEHIFAVNTRGTFNMLREAFHRMSEYGRIVNISSSLVHAPLPGLSVYTASKAAVEALTFVAAQEMRGRNITVNCVAPGATSSEVFLQGKTKETIDYFAQRPPLERLGTATDIANVVAFLVSPAGEWINGQTLRANGGAV